MRPLLTIFVIFFSLLPSVKTWASECSESFEKVQEERENAHKLELESRNLYNTALEFRQKRSPTVLPTAGTPEATEWRRNLSYETSYYLISAQKLREAAKVYSDPGKKDWYRRNQARRTWFDSDLSDILNSRNNQCVGEFIIYKGRNMSIFAAAQSIARETDLELSNWETRITQMKNWSKIDEASEILRLDPETTRWCYDVVKNMAAPDLQRNFCAKLDSLGRKRLMPFIGCKSNLDFFGFKDRAHTDFFQVCSNVKFLNEMTRSQTFRTCMNQQARILQNAPDTAQRCYDELNIATHGSAPRLSSPSETTNNAISSSASVQPR